MTRSSCGHGPPLPWRGVVTGLLAAALLVVGCGKKAGSSGPSAPGDAGAPPYAEEAPAMADDGGGLGDPLGQAQAELEGYEDALLAAGVELPADVAQARTDAGKSSVPAQAGGDATTPADRCQRRCDLATNICELRDRICALADDHGGEARYAQVCERATLDCSHATEACEGCEG